MSAQQAADACGLSLRHFHRVIQDFNIEPMKFNRGGARPKFFFTPLQVETIRSQRAKGKVA